MDKITLTVLRRLLLTGFFRTASLIGLLMLLNACQSTSSNPPNTYTEQRSNPITSQDKYEAVDYTPPTLASPSETPFNLSPPTDQQLLLQHLQDLIDHQHYIAVIEILNILDASDFSIEQVNQLHFFESQCLLALGESKAARNTFSKVAITSLPSPSDAYLFKAKLMLRNDLPTDSAITLSRLTDSRTMLLRPTLWQRFQLASLDDLIHYPTDMLTEQQRAWRSLAILSKRYTLHLQLLNQNLLLWRKQHPNIKGTDGLFEPMATIPQQPKNIAVILPLSGHYQTLGLSIQQGLLYRYYHTLNVNPEIQLTFYDSTAYHSMKALYQTIQQSSSDLVIGPLTKDHVQQWLSENPDDIPTITLNFSAKTPSTSAYQFGLSPADDAKATALMAWRKGHQNAIILAPDTDKGRQVASVLANTWISFGGRMTDHYYFSKDSQRYATNLAELLHIETSKSRAHALERLFGKTIGFSPSAREDYDVIFFVGNAKQGSAIKPLLKFYYVTQPVYATASINDGANKEQMHDMGGMVFCDMPWITQTNQAIKTARNSPLNQGAFINQRLYALGMDAFVIATHLPHAKQYPLLPIFGSTGTLYFNQAKRRFYRVLPCSRYNSHGNIYTFT